MSHHPHFFTRARRAASVLMVGASLVAAGCASSSSSNPTNGPRYTAQTRTTFTASLDLDAFRALGFDLGMLPLQSSTERGGCSFEAAKGFH